MKIVRNEGENRLRFAGDRRPYFELGRNQGENRKIQMITDLAPNPSIWFIIQEKCVLSFLSNEGEIRAKIEKFG